jgi:hypothetical protein
MNHGTLDMIKTGGDVVAAGFTIGVLAAILPPMAALFTLIWTGMRIYEGLTGQPFSQSPLAKMLTGRR